MTKWVTFAADGKTVDVTYLYDPRPDVTATEADDGVFSGWYFDGSEWTPPPPSPPTNIVPSVVSAYQAKAALMQAGLYDKAAAAAQAASGLVALAWSTATEFQRSSPNIATLAAELSLTDAQVDDLFRAASTITA